MTKKPLTRLASDRPQRRRSSLKAPPGRPGRRPGGSGAAASSAAAGEPANVRVVVRVRPENERERQGNHKIVVRPLDDHMLLFDPRQDSDDFYFQGVRQRCRDLTKRASKNVQYMFDRIFHPHHSNQQVFEATTKDVVDAVIDGFNCSVFAYGSTGAGKTHTMLGAATEPGIIFLTVMELYQRIEKLPDKKCDIDVSYVEVYNESVRDLLTPGGSLELREDGQRAVVIAGLSSFRPSGPDHLMSVLEAGNKNRTQHPTDMNAESSRSHAVFQVMFRQSDSASGLSSDVRVSKLSLIDLAGSERGSATGHKGARFREGANINCSLLALGSCINALADGKKFVPYRDSKLTRLLKDSIGGNCRTVMIANVTPSAASYEDSHNTLKYAQRAKAIKTRLKRNVVSVDFHVSQYARIVEELKVEVASLRAQLAEATISAASATAADAPDPTTAAADAPDPTTAAAAADTAPTPLPDYGPLRAAEEARRRLLGEQLQLAAEQQQLQLRLHRRRLQAQREALLWPAARSRSGPHQIRLQARLADSQPRTRAATDRLAEATERALAEAARLPAGAETDRVTAELTSQRKLDEARQEAAHLESMCRLQQQQLAAQDQLLTAAVSTAGEQHRLLNKMNFVTPQLETHYKELVALVVGQKEVAWMDQQQPPADSPGQPTYDVTALLRLPGTTYTPVSAVRHPIGGQLCLGSTLSTREPPTSAPPVVAPNSSATEFRAFVTSVMSAGGVEQRGVADRGDATTLLPTPTRSHEATVSPLAAPARSQEATVSPLAAPARSQEATVSPLAAPARSQEVAVSPLAAPARSQEVAVSPLAAPARSQEVAVSPLADVSCLSRLDGVLPPGETTLGLGNTEEALIRAEPPLFASPELATCVVGAPSSVENADRLTVVRSTLSAPAVSEASDAPAGRGIITRLSARSDVSITSPQQCDRDLTELSVHVERAPSVSPATNHVSRDASPTVSPVTAEADVQATPPLRDAKRALDATFTSPPAGPDESGAPDTALPRRTCDSLNVTQTLPSGEHCPVVPATARLNVTFTSPEPTVGTSVRSGSMNDTFTSLPNAPTAGVTNAGTAPNTEPKQAADLNATQTLFSSKCVTSDDLGVTRVLRPTAAPVPSLNATRFLSVPSSVDLNCTVTLPRSGSEASAEPVSAPAMPAADATSPLPVFDASPISSGAPPPLFAGLELPPTPEILRRVRTPLKAKTTGAAAAARDPQRQAAAPVSSAAGLDATFSVDSIAGGGFRAPSANGSLPSAAGGGTRAVPGRAGLSTLASAERRRAPRADAGLQQRPGAHTQLKGFLSSAPARGTMSMQKSKSTSRLHGTTPTRDENRQPGWGRTTVPQLSAPSAEKKPAQVSAVGRLGLGRSKMAAGMPKSKSVSALKPANR